MRRAGQPLDGWQADAVELLLAFREDGRFACFEFGEIVSRQAGKGAILEARALAGLFLLGEQLIMWSAHEYKTSLEAFRRVRRLLKALGREVNPNLIDVGGILVKINNTNGEESFERLDTEQRIKFLARSKGSGRGFSGDCNIIDETFAYTRDQQEALMPTILARPNSQIIYTSTPPLDAASGEPLFALRDRAEDGGDESLGWRDWGLPQDLEQLDEIDLDDRALWRAVNPALGGARVTEETVARLRSAMSAEGFAREVLCMWPRRRTGGGVIGAERWGGLFDEQAATWGTRPDQVAFALWVNQLRTRAYLMYAGQRNDGRLQVGFAAAPFRSTARVVAELARLREDWRPVAIAVDTRSEALRQAIEEAGIKLPEDPERPERGDLAIPTAADTAAAFGMFLDAVHEDSDRLRHLDEAPLNASVLSAQTRALAGGLTWDDRGGDEAGPVKAATLAVWAFETRAPVVNDSYNVLESVL